MPRTVTMPKTVSSTEAKARFGALLKWANKSNGTVIVKRYGKPVAVILSYAEYEEFEQIVKHENKRRALEALKALRDEARLQNPDLTAEDAYRLAGFSDEVIQETLQADAELSAAKP